MGLGSEPPRRKKKVFEYAPPPPFQEIYSSLHSYGGVRFLVLQKLLYGLLLSCCYCFGSHYGSCQCLLSFQSFFGTVCTHPQHHTFIGVYNGKGNFEALRDGETLLSKLESETLKKFSWRRNGKKKRQIRDSETHQKHFQDFEIGPKFSETRVFRGSILYLFLWSFTCFVPVRRLPRPSRSMYFGDVSRTNGRVKLARSTWPEKHRLRAIMRPRRDPNGSLRAR